MKMIEQMWEHFAAVVIADDAPEVQRQEMRKAFFAGAACVYEMIVSKAGNASSDRGLQIMTDLYEELSAFGANLDAEHPRPRCNG